MAEVDTSSYKLPVLKSPLEIAGGIADVQHKFGALQEQQQSIQSNALTISKQKLDLYNQHFGIINDELSTLANDPKTTPQEVITRMHRKMDAFDANPQVRSQMEAEFSGLPNKPLGKDGSNNPALARQLDFVKRRAQSINDRIKSLYGETGSINDNQNINPSRTYERGGPVPSGPPIAINNPPTTPSVDTRQILPNGQINPNFNQPIVLGQTPPQLPAGAVPVPGGFPSQYRMGRLPIAPSNPPMVNAPPGGPTPALPIAPRGNTGLTPDTVSPNQVVQNRSPIATGPNPLYEAGKNQYIEDQNLAASKSTDIKPAELALSLMKDLRSGPGTPTWNHAIALLKANNIISTQTENDPTKIYQEVNKYLNQYVQKNGSRSDADLAQREASNPNVGVQINPALKALTSSQVARDKIEIARSAAFEGNDYSKYGEHKASFPNKMDQRAFEINHMEPKERNALLNQMQRKLDSKNPKDRAEALKFRNSLEIADKQGLIQ